MAKTRSKLEDCNWETIVYGHCPQPLNVNWPAKQANSVWKKSKIRAITPLTVTQDHRGRYQSKARMRLPIID